MAKPFRHKHLMISGSVQGVGYRYCMHQQATALGVAGWCRNLPDGRVEAQVYGPSDPVEALIAWCQKGPWSAVVGEVVVQDLPTEESMVEDIFEIRI